MYEVQETVWGYRVLRNGVPMTVDEVREIVPDAVVLHNRRVINFLLPESARDLVEKLKKAG